MLKFIKDWRRGAGFLEGYGDHPGTVIMLGFLAAGALAGAEAGGLLGLVLGLSMMALVLVPFWAGGCVARARSHDRRMKRLEGLRDN